MKKETHNIPTDVYDVIFTGASFAGLAAANQLHGQSMLLIDRKSIGSCRCGFSAAQAVLTQLPTPWINMVARVFTNERVLPWALGQYWNLTRA